MAKKKAPQRLAGAEESCISPEQEAIIQWFRTVKFRKKLLGGVDEAAMWKKLEELYALYEAAIRAERTRYNVLLEQQTGSRNPDAARSNPPVTYGDSPPNSGALGMEMTFGGRGEQQQTIMQNRKVSGSAKGSPTRGAGERSETEGFNPAASSDPQKEAHSDAPAGQ